MTFEQSSRIPPKQQPHEQAYELAFDALIGKDLEIDKLKALGADRDSNTIRLPALNRILVVDPAAREVFVEGGGRARRTWALLALHYLCAEDVTLDLTQVSFKHFSDSRSYYSVFEKRILGRFLFTIGKTREQFEQLSEKAGGVSVSGIGASYRFDVLPRVPLTFIRYDEDEEFDPSANVLYRADAEHLMPAEDRIIAAELLLDTLSGKPLEEKAGG